MRIRYLVLLQNSIKSTENLLLFCTHNYSHISHTECIFIRHDFISEHLSDNMFRKLITKLQFLKYVLL